MFSSKILKNKPVPPFWLRSIVMERLRFSERKAL